MTRIPFFLAIAVTERVALLLPAGLPFIGDAARTEALPRKAERKFSVSDICVILCMYEWNGGHARLVCARLETRVSLAVCGDDPAEKSTG